MLGGWLGATVGLLSATTGYEYRSSEKGLEEQFFSLDTQPLNYRADY
jgi:hypothetical protein